MSNLATVTHLRPSQRPVERRVAEVEDGYTRLANALYEELIGADLTKNQSKVAHAICRKTYGYGIVTVLFSVRLLALMKFFAHRNFPQLPSQPLLV